MVHPKILAVIPAYNSSKYIEKSIISLLNQDYPYINKLVIDDCSDDNTYEIIIKYKHRLTVLRNEKNCGLSFSLNRALSYAGVEEFLFILEDDIELVDSNYITRALVAFENKQIAIVCGQAVDFTRDRLSLDKRCFARYMNVDYQDTGIKEVSYTLLKADLIRILSIERVGGFNFAGNKKLGAEDQILAKILLEYKYILLKDSAIRYHFDFARKSDLCGLLRSEANSGHTLGVAISSELINASPHRSEETKRKRNYRLGQVIFVAILLLSPLVTIYSFRLALFLFITTLLFRFIYHITRSAGFICSEKFYYVIIGIVNDFTFAIPFFVGVIIGYISKIKL